MRHQLLQVLALANPQKVKIIWQETQLWTETRLYCVLNELVIWFLDCARNIERLLQQRSQLGNVLDYERKGILDLLWEFLKSLVYYPSTVVVCKLCIGITVELGNKIYSLVKREYQVVLLYVLLGYEHARYCLTQRKEKHALNLLLLASLLLPQKPQFIWPFLGYPLLLFFKYFLIFLQLLLNFWQKLCHALISFGL